MPVKVVRRGSKYFVVEASTGTRSSTAKRGGHSTRAAAQAQANAHNAHLPGKKG